MDPTPYTFQLFLQPVCCWFWCYRTTCYEDKGLETEL